jgi:hypothetical protein
LLALYEKEWDRTSAEGGRGQDDDGGAAGREGDNDAESERESERERERETALKSWGRTALRKGQGRNNFRIDFD